MTSIRPRPATITDIARQAGVSTATVSYALNDAPGSRIPESTRSRVRAAADELGYVPHSSARSLRTGTSDVVLYVQLENVRGQLAADFTHELTLGVRELGYTFMQYGAEPHRGVKAARNWARLRPAAVIAGIDRLTPAGVELMRKAGIRVLAAGGTSAAAKELGVSRLAMDHRGVGRVAAEHLLGRGHQDIAAVVPTLDPLRQMGNERLAGLRETAEAAGARVSPFEMDWSPESATALVARWRQEGMPESVFGYNDEFSGLLLGALLDAGVRVPEEVGLVGTDDVMLCRMLRPQLSSVRMDRGDVSDMARCIVDVIRGGPQADFSPWTPTMVERQT